MPLSCNDLADTVRGIEPTTARNGIYARRAESANDKHLDVRRHARLTRNAPETSRQIAPKLHLLPVQQEEVVNVERTKLGEEE